MDRWDSSLGICSLRLDFDAGITPATVIQSVYERIEHHKKQQQPSVWLHLQPVEDVLARATELPKRWPDASRRPALWGVPFSVKDNIDVAGVPTTNACPGLSYTPTETAPAVQRCIDAGALFIGKVNMEQLATGIVGCRSPYGTLHSVFSKDHVVGGSSSGAAVSVAEGLVSFALASDTAGSIRVPAAFNGLVGFKPTKGMISACGCTPLIASMDTVAVMALTTADAREVWRVCEAFDKDDIHAKSDTRRLPAYRTTATRRPSRLRIAFGVPPADKLGLFCSAYRDRFAQVVAVLQESGAEPVDLDWAPFAEADRLLREGTLSTERSTTLRDGWLDEHEQHLLPLTAGLLRQRFLRDERPMDIFHDLHRQAACIRAVEGMLTCEWTRSSGASSSGAPEDDDDDDDDAQLTILVLPSAVHHPTLDEVRRDRVGSNAALASEFSFFGNVLDLTGIALPCGTYRAGGGPDLPCSVTIWAGRCLDEELLEVARGLEERLRDL